MSATGFYFFIAHSLTTPKPFISIEIFRDRNFVIGLVFMFMCGVLLVASMALMAPFLQGVMGYPIIDAGLLLATRGIGMAFAMLTAGRLMTRIDPRLMLAFGLTCCTVSLYYSIDFAPDTAVRTIVWVSMLQGFGLGFLFVPLNTVALSSVRPQLLTQATAMWTLIRNLGSSIGVSIVIANLTNKTILMHARLAESITPFNQALADPAAAMLDPKTEMGRALLEQIMTQQAAIIAYANDFKLMMIMTIVAFPLIVLIRVRGLGLRPAPRLQSTDTAGRSVSAQRRQLVCSIRRAKLDCAHVPLAGFGDVGLDAHGAHAGKLARIIGGRQHERAPCQPSLRGAQEELPRLRDVALLQIALAARDQLFGILPIRRRQRRHLRAGRRRRSRRSFSTAAGAGGAEAGVCGWITSDTRASASSLPSSSTRLMRSSDLPDTDAGRFSLRRGSPLSGIAQAPGAIECPSERDAVGGKPLSRRKLFLGINSVGAMRICKGIWLAGSATTVASTAMRGVSAPPV